MHAAGIVTDPDAVPLVGASVLIDGDLISAIGPRADMERRAPAGTRAIDLGGATLLPGLIDTHMHVTTLGGGHAASDHWDVEEIAANSIHHGEMNLLDAVRRGVTTVRDAGSFDGPMLELRRRIDAQQMAGPRIMPTGSAVTTPKGHAYWWGGEVDGVKAIRELVRRKADAGMSHVKVMVTGGYATPGSSPTTVQFSIQELSVLVEEAHRLGMPTMAHLTAVEGIRVAVEAGIDSLEHLSMLGSDGSWQYPDDLIATIVSGACWVDPTPAFHYHSVTSPPADMDAARLAELKDRRAARTKGIQKLLAAGQKRWLAGSDIGGTNPLGIFPVVCQLMVAEIGMTPRDAIRSATTDAAKALRMEKRIGTLVAGKVADVLAVDGDPLEDISSLTRVRKVIVRGRELEDLPVPSVN